MTTFMIEDSDGLVNVLHFAPNSLLSQYTITCSNSHKMFREVPLSEL